MCAPRAEQRGARAVEHVPASRPRGVDDEPAQRVFVPILCKFEAPPSVTTRGRSTPPATLGARAGRQRAVLEQKRLVASAEPVWRLRTRSGRRDAAAHFRVIPPISLPSFWRTSGPVIWTSTLASPSFSRQRRVRVRATLSSTYSHQSSRASRPRVMMRGRGDAVDVGMRRGEGPVAVPEVSSAVPSVVVRSFRQLTSVRVSRRGAAPTCGASAARLQLRSLQPNRYDVVLSL